MVRGPRNIRFRWAGLAERLLGWGMGQQWMLRGSMHQAQARAINPPPNNWIDLNIGPDMIEGLGLGPDFSIRLMQ